MTLAGDNETILTNAEVVTPTERFRGSVALRDGRIADIATGGVHAASAIDCEGDFLIPGLVELHTDNLERHLQPRPGVHWPRRAAVAAHDGEFVSVGVTTVFDALRVGSMNEDGLGDYAKEAAAAITALRALNLLKADHYVHLRCEICSPNLEAEFDSVGGDPRMRLFSIMDHTPGQRQFADESKLRAYYQGKHGWSDQRMTEYMRDCVRLQLEWEPRNRAVLVARRDETGATVASHDDAEQAHVDQSTAAGATLAEFPTTERAAEASRSAGMHVIMGAPNLLRGFSHSGNVSAMTLAQAGLVDILSSDYAPASLMLGAFKLSEEGGYTLPAAIACVTKTPAESVGLNDRGAIEIGKRADLARVYRAERLCVTRAVWREGRRVM